MKKILLAVPYLLSALFTVAQAPKEKSLLWKIEGNGLSSPSYLYGTIHIMCPDEIRVTPALQSAFNSTRQVYLELEMDDPGVMARMMTGMMMNDGSSLQTLLSQKDYDSVAAIFQSTTKMPLGMMSRAKPILLMSMIYPSLLGCSPEGWETKLVAMAAERQMDVQGLEQVEEQIAVLDSIPYKVQAQMFLKTMYNLDSTRSAFEKMVEVYQNQDIEEMIRMTSSDEDFGEYEELMLKKRNRNWISRMQEVMKEKPTFFAVGAGHLGGTEGVIALLRKQGYTVQPVSY